MLWRAFAFIARTRLCARVEACLCKEAVMVTGRRLVLRSYGVEDANWSHPIFPPVTTATILAARNFFFHHHNPGGLSEPSVGVAKSSWEPTKPYMVNVPEVGTGGGV